MFSAFIGHGPLYKSKRKNVGKLFTPVVTVAFVLLVAILLVCILAPVVAPYGPNAQDLTQVLAKPSAAHWLGCDQPGRDIFSRIIYGGRTALVSAVLVQLIEIVLKRYVHALYQSLGVYLPLITTNCCVLGVTILAVQDYTKVYEAQGFGMAYAEALICAAGAGVGFLVAMLLICGDRQRVERSNPPESFKGLPITLVSAAITAMSFMGFGGLVENIIAALM